MFFFIYYWFGFNFFFLPSFSDLGGFPLWCLLTPSGKPFNFQCNHLINYLVVVTAVGETFSDSGSSRLEVVMKMLLCLFSDPSMVLLKAGGWVCLDTCNLLQDHRPANLLWVQSMELLLHFESDPWWWTHSHDIPAIFKVVFFCLGFMAM